MACGFLHNTSIPAISNCVDVAFQAFTTIPILENQL